VGQVARVLKATRGRVRTPKASAKLKKASDEISHVVLLECDASSHRFHCATLSARASGPGSQIPLQINHLHAFARGAPGIEIAETFRHRTDCPIADLAIVDFCDGGQFSHCACAKYFMRAMDVEN